ncbi:hypothetical protein AB834_06815 [PVC group bacterium (ex Bugula neritina AB1)]|nr:hypothetical protein AB834_06815 [PVC group bacterium (ex Bugula neritina AB1)]
MEITELKVFPKEGADKKLKAYVTITFEGSFVVRDLKIIDGNQGLFVAMPSRKVKEACLQCHNKNPIRSRYCSYCGKMLEWKSTNEQKFQSDHRDIAHPITVEAREYIQSRVLDAYAQEIRKKQYAEVS